MSTLTNRFLSAVRLCTGPLAIKKRLTAAWLEHLDGIAPDELPGNLQKDFIGLRKAMYTHVPMPMESGPQASIRKMSAHEATVHTDTIIMLYTKLVLLQSRNDEHPAAEGRKSARNGRRFKESIPILN